LPFEQRGLQKQPWPKNHREPLHHSYAEAEDEPKLVFLCLPLPRTGHRLLPMASPSPIRVSARAAESLFRLASSPRTRSDSGLGWCPDDNLRCSADVGGSAAQFNSNVSAMPPYLSQTFAAPARPGTVDTLLLRSIVCESPRTSLWHGLRYWLCLEGPKSAYEAAGPFAARGCGHRALRRCEKIGFGHNMSHNIYRILRKTGVGFAAFSVSWHFFTPSQACCS
jgi:hypothetical protein